MVTSFELYNDVTDQRATGVRLFVFKLIWVCEMGKNNGNYFLTPLHPMHGLFEENLDYLNMIYG